MNYRKSSLLALALTLSCSLYAQDVQKTPQAQSRLRDTCDLLHNWVITPALKTITLPFRVVMFGTFAKIDEEMEAEIRDIAKEMGINHNFVVTTLSRTKLKKITPKVGKDGKIIPEEEDKKDPFPIAFALGSTLCIGEEFYASLTLEERRALVGHELTHIKNYDHLSSIIANICLVEGLFYAFRQFAPSQYALRFDPKVVNGSLVAGILGIFAIEDYITRRKEKRADIEGTTTLDCCEGGACLMERLVEQNLKWRKSSFFGKLFVDSEGNNRLDFAHPKLTDRIAYLRELAAAQEATPAVAPVA